MPSARHRCCLWMPFLLPKFCSFCFRSERNSNLARIYLTQELGKSFWKSWVQTKIMRARQGACFLPSVVGQRASTIAPVGCTQCTARDGRVSSNLKNNSWFFSRAVVEGQMTISGQRSKGNLQPIVDSSRKQRTSQISEKDVMLRYPFKISFWDILSDPYPFKISFAHLTSNWDFWQLDKISAYLEKYLLKMSKIDIFNLNDT